MAVPELKLANTQPGTCTLVPGKTPVPINSWVELRFVDSNGVQKFISASDAKTLYFEITEDPQFGSLVYEPYKVDQGLCYTTTGIDWVVGATPAYASTLNCPTGTCSYRKLPYSETKNGLQYKLPTNSNITGDAFKIKAYWNNPAEGGKQYISNEITVSLCPKSTPKPPTITSNNPLVIWECGSGAFNKNSANSAIDVNATNHIKTSNPNTGTNATQPVLFKVVSSVQPAVGSLQYKGAAVTTTTIITQADIDAGLLTYSYDCANNPALTADKTVEFYLQPYILISSTTYSGTVTKFSITIKKVADPQVVQSGPLNIETKSALDAGCIDSSKFLAMTTGKTIDTMKFTLKGLPQYGTLYMSSGSGKPTTSTTGWSAVSANTEYDMKILSNPCGLLYVIDDATNNDTSATKNWTTSFKWTARDTSTGKTIPADATFTINITKKANTPPSVTTKTLRIKCDNTTHSRAFNDPQDKTDPGATITITDAEDTTMSKPESFVIKVVTLPTHGTLKFNGSELAVGGTFTYKDVLTGTAIVYQHDGTPNYTDSIALQVIDQSNTVDINIPVTIDKCVEQPSVVTACVEVKMPDEQKNKTVIPTKVGSKNYFVISDAKNTAANQFEFQITKLPENGGKLFMSGSEVAVNNWLAYDSVVAGNFSYQPSQTLDVNKDADRNITTDSYKFKVRNKLDTSQSWGEFTQCITLIWAPKPTPPVRDVSTCLALQPGSTQFYNEHRLNETTLTIKSSMTDAVSGPFYIQVSSLPQYGVLKVDGTPITTGNLNQWIKYQTWDATNKFKAQQIVSYTPNAGIPSNVTSDSFTFLMKDDLGRINTNSQTYCVEFQWPKPGIKVDMKCLSVRVPSEVGKEFTLDTSLINITTTPADTPVEVLISTLPVDATLKVNGTTADATTWFDWPATLTFALTNGSTKNIKNIFKFKVRAKGITEVPTTDYSYCVTLVQDPPPSGPTVTMKCLDVKNARDSVNPWVIDGSLLSMNLENADPNKPAPQFEMQITKLPKGVLEIGGHLVTQADVTNHVWFDWPDTTNTTYKTLSTFEETFTYDPFYFICRVKTVNGDGTISPPPPYPADKPIGYEFCINLTWPEIPVEKYLVGRSCLEVTIPDTTFQPVGWTAGLAKEDGLINPDFLITANKNYALSDLSFVFKMKDNARTTPLPCISYGDLLVNGTLVNKDNQGTLPVTLDNMGSLIFKPNTALNANKTISSENLTIVVSHKKFPGKDQEYDLCLIYKHKTTPTEEDPGGTVEVLNRGIVGACIGQTAQIKSTDLSVSYPDGKGYSDTSFTFTVTSIPQHGDLTKNGTTLAVNDSFTLDDLKMINMAYVNTSSPSNAFDETFGYEMSYTDTTGAVKTVTGTFKISLGICFKIINTGPLMLQQAGLTTAINGSLLLAQDSMVTADDVIFTITDVSNMNCGYLQFSSKKNLAITNISQSQISTGQLEFVDTCNSDTAINNTFRYSVTNGNATLTGIFSIIRSSTPGLIQETNSGISLPSKSCKTITSTFLKYSQQGTSADQITYTVTSNVLHGALNKTTFTQQDLDDGNVTYCHNDENFLSDSFTFDVTTPTASVTNKKFNISIIVVPSTILLNTGMTMGICRTKAINIQMLDVLKPPPGVNDTDIKFTVTRVPNYPTEPMQILYKGAPMKVGDVFNRKDILDGAITAKHTTLNIGSFYFSFTWVAGNVYSPAPAQFDITVEKAGLSSWMSKINEFTVKETETHVLTKDDIMASDIRNT